MFETLDFETHSSGQMLLILHQVCLQDCLVVLVCQSRFQKCSTLYLSLQKRNTQVSIFSRPNQHMPSNVQRCSQSLKEWPRCHSAVLGQISPAVPLLTCFCFACGGGGNCLGSDISAPCLSFCAAPLCCLLQKEEQLGLIVVLLCGWFVRCCGFVGWLVFW